MKKILACGTVVGCMAMASVASANVKSVELFAGRMSMPSSCFVQVDLVTVEENMFNGQEKLRFGDQEVGTFQPLLQKNVTLSPGKSVLFGSQAFAQEVGLQPDITLADGVCETLGPNLELSLFGSFGDLAAALTTPNDFPALTVVGALLRIDLELQSYKVKSLTGEKEIGNTSGSSSGGSSSGESSSGGGSSSSSGGASGGTSSGESASGGTTAPAAEDDGGCSVTAGATGATAPGTFAVGGIALAAAALRRRRSKH